MPIFTCPNCGETFSAQPVKRRLQRNPSTSDLDDREFARHLRNVRRIEDGERRPTTNPLEGL